MKYTTAIIFDTVSNTDTFRPHLDAQLKNFIEFIVYVLGLDKIENPITLVDSIASFLGCLDIHYIIPDNLWHS